MARRIARIALALADGFVALTAIGGGITLAAGVDRFPRAWLADTPFASYLVPGLMLALIVGGSAAVATVGVALGRAWGARASSVAGTVLMGWILGEVLLLKQPSAPTPTEVVYFLVGAAMAALGWWFGRSAERLA